MLLSESELGVAARLPYSLKRTKNKKVYRIMDDCNRGNVLLLVVPNIVRVSTILIPLVVQGYPPNSEADKYHIKSGYFIR